MTNEPRRPRLLLLEDSDIDAELMTIHLQRAELQFEIVRAVKRSEFERLLATGPDGPIDLVLADYSLPDFDGYQALALARDILPHVPFIFVSGIGGEDLATNALRRGATDYVMKRNLARLPSSIARALAEARERAQRQRAEAEQQRLQAALMEANAALEQRVAERTRELTAEIAERSRVEDTLRQMQRLEAVGQLTSGVAHDFNNLLMVVISNISLIGKLLAQNPPVDERVTQRLASMRDAARRGGTLTKQLLAFSRRQRLEPQAVDFNDTVLGMRDLLQTTLGGSVHLTTELAESLWPALVDPTQLELIILNLAINARDAMEVGGSLRVQTSNVSLTQPPSRPEEPEPGDYVALSVIDTGSGMSEEVLAKAFEPFFTTKEVGKGSGLGLAQVYGFAKQSGGGVRIDTELGSGTAVHVFMPRSRAAPAEAAAKSAAVAGPAPAAQADGAGPAVLVVDDDNAVREATASLLQLHGFRVTEAVDGPSALAQASEREDLRIVIADFAMPRMNGAELARALHARRPDLPVLFMTGFAELGALDGVGEDFVLQKPIDDAELVARLRRLLDR